MCCWLYRHGSTFMQELLLDLTGDYTRKPNTDYIPADDPRRGKIRVMEPTPALNLDSKMTVNPKFRFIHPDA